MRACQLIFIAACVVFDRSGAIPIDNGVEGDPEIECGASALTVNFNTRNTFSGHVYVKGRFAEQGCRSDESGRKIAGIVLPFTTCGVQRTRSLNPRGIFVSVTVVVTFHPQVTTNCGKTWIRQYPRVLWASHRGGIISKGACLIQFLTKVDRAYTVQCFYMEADKTVSQELEVSEITTLFHSQTVPMPVCRYDILDGSPTGQPIKYALIGQQVYHKWTCVTETTDIFCMVVHDCFVDDGADNKALLLNENGCALDRFLLQNLEYTSDLMAGREAHVFKYADKAALFFQCQITITVKEPGQQCPRPECPQPGGIGGGLVAGSGATGPKSPPATGAPKVPAKPSGPAPVAPAAQTPGQNPAPTAGIGVEAPTRRPKARPDLFQTPGGPSVAPSYTGEPPRSEAPAIAPSYTGEPATNAPIAGSLAPAYSNGPAPPVTNAPSVAPATPGEAPVSQNVPVAPAYTGGPPPSGVPITGAPSLAPAYTGAPEVPNRVPLDVATGVPPSQLRASVPPATNAPQQPAATGPAPSGQPIAYGTNAPSIPSAGQPSSEAPPPPPAAYSQAPQTPGAQPASETPAVPRSTSGGIGSYAGDLPLPLDFELRKKRSARFADEVGTWDLRAQPIVTFDIDDDSSLVHDLRARNQQLVSTSVQPSLAFDGQLYCLTSASFGLFLSFLAASTLTAVAFCFLFCVRNHSMKHK